MSAGDAAPPLDVEALDKKALRRLIKSMGGDCDAEDKEKVLRKKAKKLLAVTKVLNPRAVDGVVATLPDCKGLFLDPTTTMCQKCPEQKDCKAKFDENVKNKFPQIRRQHVDKALSDLKANPKGKATEKAKEEPKKTEAPKAKPAAEKKAEDKPKVIAAAKTKDGKTLTFARGIRVIGEHPKDNPYEKGEEVYDLVKAVLNKKPKTIGDLLGIYGTLYELPKKPTQQLAEAVNMIDWLRESEIVKLKPVEQK